MPRLPAPLPPPSNVAPPAAEEALAAQLHRVLLDRAAEGSREGEAGLAVADRARAVTDREAPLLHATTRARLAGAVARRATGLGPLEPLLADPAVDEVMVTGCAPIWVERGGRLERTTARFEGEAALREVADRMLAPLGRRVDAAQPMCDARLPDGSRVNVTIPPLAVDGTTITIRRFRTGGHDLAGLVAAGAWSAEAAELLSGAVRARRTILVSGATGAGKTTVLGALSAAIPAGERVITIEDAAELALHGDHVVRLEARPANVEGDGEVPLRALVRNAMRMRPDRLVVGEVRGAEALDLLVALTSGHAGGLSTIHAGSPAQALRRLELLAMLAGAELPLPAIRALAAGGIDLVVQLVREPDGRRRLGAVAQVGDDGTVTTLLQGPS